MQQYHRVLHCRWGQWRSFSQIRGANLVVVIFLNSAETEGKSNLLQLYGNPQSEGMGLVQTNVYSPGDILPLVGTAPGAAMFEDQLAASTSDMTTHRTRELEARQRRRPLSVACQQVLTHSAARRHV